MCNDQMQTGTLFWQSVEGLKNWFPKSGSKNVYIEKPHNKKPVFFSSPWKTLHTFEYLWISSIIHKSHNSQHHKAIKTNSYK